MVDVRYWHKADMLSCTAHVRLVLIADIGENERQDRFLLAKRLSRSLISANKSPVVGAAVLQLVLAAQPDLRY